MCASKTPIFLNIQLFWFVGNVMTAFDPPFERLFYEYFNSGFRFKGG